MLHGERQRSLSARTVESSDAARSAMNALDHPLPLRRISTWRRRWFRASLALACCASATLGGCLAIRTPEPGAPARARPGEGIVFGRIRVFDRGFELDPWKIELSEILVEKPVLRLALFQIESGRKRPDVPVEEGGRFEWILPSGTYLLYHTPAAESPYNEPLAAFQVAPGEDALDLGELELAISVDRPLSWELATYTLSGVEARAGRDKSDAWFLERHPGTGAVQHGAFVADDELQGLFTNWSREACARILARHGMDSNRFEGR